MTRRSSDPRDADTQPVELDPIARELERYAGLTAGEMAPGLSDRVMDTVSDEPIPRRGLLASLFGPFGAGGGAPRFLLVGATMALGILTVVLAGGIAGLLPDDQIGPSPSPSIIEPPSVSPSPTISPSPSEEPTRSPRATRTPRPSESESPDPSATDDDDDERETPEPSDDDDNSGPGGGDDDNSGPGGGGGDDDNSGPGGGSGPG
jgi:hypothetical protein